MKQMRWLRFGGMMLGATAVLLLLLIALGVFDPKPVGNLTATAVPHTLTIPAKQQDTYWLPEPLPPGNLTIRATVAHQSGELDSGAGLVLGDGDTAVIITISPLGYVNIKQAEPITDYRLPITAMPWQPWPHVKTDSEPNELWLDSENGQWRIWINRELLWAGDAPFQPMQLGLYGESFGNMAVFHFQRIELFTDTD